MTKLYGVLYTSTLSATAGISVVPAILTVARARNQRDGVTGVLVFDGQNFCQYIEGERASIRACMDRIFDDTRHTDIELSHDGAIADRHFKRFLTGYASPDGEDLVGSVRGLSGLPALDRLLGLLPGLDLDL
ncbi:MAG: BLUF domain-containing protein [Ramlibacter sp.]|nr:BLUF domain-containing protein [Ramlibacter sp.]